MFPQALVQNRIISQSNDNFTLNWAAAAPILNANYFYIDQLINESYKYSKLLRPWTPIEPDETDPENTNLKIHEYYSANFYKASYGIHIGDWVGRVRNTNPEESILEDCLVLTRSVGYYIYDDIIQAFVPNNMSGVPCIVRPSLWGLNEHKQVQLNNNAIRRIDGYYQYVCHSSDIKFKGNHTAIPLAYTTDAVMGRIFYDDQLIAHVPVTILRKWNAQLIDYEFALQFPDLNFPPNATVEFW